MCKGVQDHLKVYKKNVPGQGSSCVPSEQRNREQMWVEGTIWGGFEMENGVLRGTHHRGAQNGNDAGRAYRFDGSEERRRMLSVLFTGDTHYLHTFNVWSLEARLFQIPSSDPLTPPGLYISSWLIKAKERESAAVEALSSGRKGKSGGLLSSHSCQFNPQGLREALLPLHGFV